MKQTLWATAFLFFALPSSAQFMPPARDLGDVQRLTAEYQRLTTSALGEPARWAEALSLITSVHVSLRQGPELPAIDSALEKIRAYEAKRERDDPPLPRDIVRYVKLVKTWLEDAKMGPPPNLYALREQIHHEVMHPMQRLLLSMVEQMQSIANSFQAMSSAMQSRIGVVVGAAASASPEKP